MPCSDSSSSIALQLDADERFINFEFAKITCGREITAETGYSNYLIGKTVQTILDLTYHDVIINLKIKDEEAQFVAYLEWDALRSALSRYVGVSDADIDVERCQITSIDYSDSNINIALVILPPKELPKILPCNLGDKDNIS